MAGVGNARDIAASDYEALVEFLYLTPIGIIKFRPDGTIEMANPAAAAKLLPLANDRDLSNIYRVFAPVAPDLRARIEAFRAPTGQICNQLQLAIPGARTVLTLGVNKIDDRTLMAVVQDITRAIEQEHRIRDDQQRFRAIFENVRDYAIYTVDLDGRLDDWNRSLDRLGGWQAADMVGMPLGTLFPRGETGQAFASDLLARARLNGTAEFEGWGLRKDGGSFWANTVATTLPDRDGNPSGYVLVTRDLTERKQMEDRLLTLATTDPLTGASNRRAGEARLEEAFTRWRRYGHSFAVLMVDVDHFKDVNDRWGHDVGDDVLVALVRQSRLVIREADVAVRWGGEEFLIVLPDTDDETAVAIAERLRLAIETSEIQGDGHVIRITISIGVATPGAADVGADDVVHRADSALYRAKRRGRNRVIAA